MFSRVSRSPSTSVVISQPIMSSPGSPLASRASSESLKYAWSHSTASLRSSIRSSGVASFGMPMPSVMFLNRMNDLEVFEREPEDREEDRRRQRLAPLPG